MAQENTKIKTFTAGEEIPAYRSVRFNKADGKVYLADAKHDSIGTSNNAAAAAGDHVGVDMWGRGGTRKVVAAGAFSIGDRVFQGTDGKFDDDPDGGQGRLLFVGQSFQEPGSDGDLAEVFELPEAGGPLVYAARATSAQVENTTDETTFDKSYTLDGAKLEVGDVLEVDAFLYVDDDNGADTLDVKLKLATETIVALGATNVATGDLIHFRALITIEAVGAGGSIRAFGTYAQGQPATAAPLNFRKASAAEDLSGDVAITVTATWSVAHADNEVQLEGLIVKHHRQ